MVRQQLRLNLGTDAELPIHPLVATGFLKHLVVFDGDARKIGHQLHVAPMHIRPNQIACRRIDIKTTAAATTGHNGCGEHPRPRTEPLNQPIHDQQLIVIGSETSAVSSFKRSKPTQQFLTALLRNRLQLIPPQATIALKRNQKGSLNPNEPCCNNRNQFQEAMQVGETALGKSQRHQQILVALLLPAQAVEQLPQRGHRLLRRVHAPKWGSWMSAGGLAAHG